MEEKYEGGEISSPFLKKLDNFWYHYKWHSLIALFFVLVFTVCAVQMCSRAEYDVHVLYAGPRDIKKTADAGLSEYRVLYSSLKLNTEDYDENGEVNPNLQTLFLPSEKEIEEINASLKEGYEVQTQLVMENADQFNSLMIMSDYYLCVLSEENYLAYRDRADGFFVSLAPYVGEAEVEYYDARREAVYLHSLALGDLPGFEDLGENTVICLRSVSEVARRADRKGSARQFSRAEQTLKNIFEATASEQ
jgi:hypothetical protein